MGGIIIDKDIQGVGLGMKLSLVTVRDAFTFETENGIWEVGYTVDICSIGGEAFIGAKDGAFGGGFNVSAGMGGGIFVYYTPKTSGSYYRDWDPQTNYTYELYRVGN